MIREEHSRIFEVAQHYHDHVMDQKYGDQPYSTHLIDVYNTALSYEDQLITEFDFDWALRSILLHDIFEDTPATIAELLEWESSGVDINAIAIAYNVTNVTCFDTKEDNERATFKRVASGYISVFVKLCDRISNQSNVIATQNTRLAKKYVRQYPMLQEFLREGQLFSRMWEQLDLQYEQMKGITNE